MSKAKYIGVLDIQGAVEEHCKMLETIDVAYKKVKYPDEIINASGLIIPGGESTTLNTIINRYGLKEDCITGIIKDSNGNIISDNSSGLFKFMRNTVFCILERRILPGTASKE